MTAPLPTRPIRNHRRISPPRVPPRGELSVGLLAAAAYGDYGSVTNCARKSRAAGVSMR